MVNVWVQDIKAMRVLTMMCALFVSSLKFLTYSVLKFNFFLGSEHSLLRTCECTVVSLCVTK